MKQSNQSENQHHHLDAEEVAHLPPEEQESHVLIRIVKWQGRAIIVLIIALAIAIAAKVYNFNFTLPNQKAVQVKPPIIENGDQVHTLAYQNSRLIQYGETVNKPELQLMGEVYDYQAIKKQWPEVYLTVNGARINIDDSSGSFKTGYTLKPGANAIETALNWNGSQHCKQQLTITYNEETAKAKNVSTTQATK